MKLDGYCEFELLGTGPLGKTYSVIKTETGQPCRIKIVSIPETLSEEERSYLKNLFFTRCLTLRKANIAHTIGPLHAGRTGNSFFIESKSIPHQPLVSLISDRPRDLIDHSIPIIRKIADILRNYHHQGLTHGNLKLSNVFLDDALQPWLTDGAVSIVYDVLRMKEKGDLRDSRYLSPAVLHGKDYGPSDDFFGLSVLFYRLVVGKYPFFERDKAISRTSSYHLPSMVREELSNNVDVFFRSVFSQNSETNISDYGAFIENLTVLEERGLLRSEEHRGPLVDRDDIASENNATDEYEEILADRKRFPIVFFAIFLLLIAGMVIGYLYFPPFRQFLNVPTAAPSAIPLPTATISALPEKSPRPGPSPVRMFSKTIISTPDDVYLSDGEAVLGTTPFTLQALPMTKMEVIMFRPGYLTRKKTFTFTSDEGEEPHVKLITNPLPYPLAPGKAWRSFAADNLNTNCSHQKISHGIAQLWSITIEPNTAAPVADKGLLYLAMPDKFLRVFDLHNGKVLDTVDGEYGSICTPALTDDYIFIGSKDGKMRAYDRAKLKMKGEESVLSAIVAPPVVSKNVLYCASLFGTVTAFDVRPKAFKKVAMKKMWEIETGERINTALALGDDRLLLVSSGVTLNAFSAMDGTIVWNFVPPDKPAAGIRLPDMISATMRLEDDDLAAAAPVICGKTVIFASLSGWLYGLNIDNGQEQWKHMMTNVVHATPACDRGLVIVAVRDGHIIALDAISGDILYRIKTDSPIIASPIIATDTVIVISETGTITLYEAVTGKQLNTLQTEGTYQHSPALAEDTLVVLSKQGRLTAFR